MTWSSAGSSSSKQIELKQIELNLIQPPMNSVTENIIINKTVLNEHKVENLGFAIGVNTILSWIFGKYYFNIARFLCTAPFVLLPSMILIPFAIDLLVDKHWIVFSRILVGFLVMAFTIRIGFEKPVDHDKKS